MKEAYLGCIVISIKGRDSGNVYAVVREDEKYVFLADGKHKRVSCPKMKNKKHIKCFGENKLSKYMSEDASVTDGRLRRALRRFTKELENEFVKNDCREEE